MQHGDFLILAGTNRRRRARAVTISPFEYTVYIKGRIAPGAPAGWLTMIP